MHRVARTIAYGFKNKKRRQAGQMHQQRSFCEATDGAQPVVGATVPIDSDGMGTPGFGNNGDDMTSIRSRAAHTTVGMSALVRPSSNRAVLHVWGTV